MDIDNTLFVGRRKELLELRKSWDKCSLFGVYGHPSIGKTSLVKKFLFYVHRFQEVSEIWVDLKNLSSMRRVFISLFAKLNMRLLDKEENIWIYKVCHRVLKLETEFVIVFDNAEDVLDKQFHSHFLHICNTILNQCRNVKMFIISTTSLDETCLLHRVCRIDLDPLSESESAELLKAKAPGVDFGGCLETIARLCEGFPLALLICASELDTQTGILNPSDMVELLVRCRLIVLSPEFYPRNDRMAAVYVDFLRRLSQLSQIRMKILATIPGTFLPRHAQKILELPSEEVVSKQVLEPTKKRHMIEHDTESGRYGIQSIIKECISIFLILKDTPDDSELRARFCKAFVDDFIEISRQFGTNYMEALCRFNVEQQNFQKLFTDVIYCREDTYDNYIRIAMSSSGIIQTLIGKQSFRFYEECLKMAKNYNQNLDEACVQVAYGCALTDLRGELKLAEQNYRSAIKTFENSQETLSFIHLHQLAAAYQLEGYNRSEQGKYQDALRITSKALELLRQLRVSYDDRIMLKSMTVLGLSHMYMCTGSIIVNGLQSVGIFDTNRGKILFRLLMSLGFCGSNIGHLRQAKEYLLEVLDRRVRSRGDEAHNDPLVGSCYNNLGVLYRKMGNFKESTKFYKLGLDVKVRRNAPENSIALSLNNVAVSLSEMGHHIQALKLLDQAFKRLDNYHGLFPGTRVTLLTTHGQILLRRAHYTTAINSLTKSKKIQMKVQQNHKSLLKVNLYLLLAYVGLKKYFRAAQIVYHVVMLLFILIFGRCFGAISKVLTKVKRHSFALLILFVNMYLLFFIGISFSKLSALRVGANANITHHYEL